MDTRQLLKKAERNLHRILEDREFWTPEFCRAFFDWCDQQAYDYPDAVIRRGDLALELAEKTGDVHSQSRAHGVMASAYRMKSLYDLGEEEIAHAFSAAGSCSCCLADAYRRQGILRMYQHEFEVSLTLYDKAISHYNAIDDNDGVGRTLVSRGISLWKLDRAEEATEQQRVALCLLAPDTPEVYHLAALTNIGIFLAREGKEHLVAAEKYCAEFRQYMAGREGFSSVVVRLRWTHGLILTRLGERKRGLQMLRKARKALMRARQDEEVIAITADITRLYCDTNKYHLIVDLMSDTLAKLGDALGTRPLLETIRAKAGRELAETRLYIAKLRESVTVAVPSLLGVDTAGDAVCAP